MAMRRELERVTGREVAMGAVDATLYRLEVKTLAAGVLPHAARCPRAR